MIKCFFQIFVTKGDTGVFLEIVQFYTVHFSLTNLQVSFRPWFNILIQKYFSEEWEQIYQFSLKSKTTGGNSATISFP